MELMELYHTRTMNTTVYNFCFPGHLSLEFAKMIKFINKRSRNITKVVDVHDVQQLMFVYDPITGSLCTFRIHCSDKEVACTLDLFTPKKNQY